MAWIAHVLLDKWLLSAVYSVQNLLYVYLFNVQILHDKTVYLNPHLDHRYHHTHIILCVYLLINANY